jgi:phage shock protein PspC (stress-responsive transcriptional regulator)
MNKKLYRNDYRRVFGGVCAGLADYFEMDVTIIRLLFAFAFFVGGVGFVPYIILWIVLPRRSYMAPNFGNPTVDYTVPPQPEGGNFYSSPFNNYNAPGFKNMDYFEANKKSTFGVIIGAFLILLGGVILANEYDIIPNIDWDRLWPVVLILVGASLIASGQLKKSWEKDSLHSTGSTKNTNGDDTAEELKTV